MRPAVFLDRDGTIIEEAEYLSDPAGARLLPGAAEGIAHLRTAGFAVVVTSNQSGVARGYFDEAAVQVVNRRVQELLTAAGAPADAFYYCPHHPEGSVPAYALDCECRKPKPGMLHAAAADLDLDLKRSWVVGDKRTDMEFGTDNGLRAVLVLTGYGRETQAEGFEPGREPDLFSSDLAAAARAIARVALQFGEL